MMDKLTFREKLAIKLLGSLKYNDKEFYKCAWNDAICKIGGIIMPQDELFELVNRIGKSLNKT